MILSKEIYKRHVNIGDDVQLKLHAVIQFNVEQLFSAIWVILNFGPKFRKCNCLTIGNLNTGLNLY